MRLRDLGHDEYWLQDRLAAEPHLLGLGELDDVSQEIHQTAGGSLDLLARRDDIHFSVEVQLGTVDASHAFRALEYWTRNRARMDGEHVAVIVAEAFAPRYLAALRLLTADLPLIVVQLEANRRDGEVVLVSKILAASAALGLDAEFAEQVLEDRTRESWVNAASPLASAALEELEAFVEERRDRGARMDYSTVAYIGVRRGRRLWAKLRPGSEGISVNVPDPDGGRVQGSPTDAFAAMRQAAAKVGVAMRWQPSSGDGTHPVNFQLRPGALREGEVAWALAACWEAFEDLEPFVARYWGPDDDDLWPDPNEATGFEPYYAVGYAEETYGSNSGYTRVDFFPTMDDWETVYSVPDEDWDDMEFARRVLMHIRGGGEPTKKIQRRFLAGPAASWEQGMRWSADQGYLAAWAREQGI